MRHAAIGSACLLLLILTAPAEAQFQGLAATADGRAVYFRSPLRLKSDPGNGGPAEDRIYRWTPQGIALLAERSAAVVPRGEVIREGAQSVDVSDDGATVAFTLSNACDAPAQTAGDCPYPDVRSFVRGAKDIDLGRATAQISRNGRWVLLTTPFNWDAPSTSTLIDMSAGERSAVPNPAWNQRRCVASDGSVLVESRDKDNNVTYGIWKQGVLTPVVSTQLAPAAISDNARVVLLSWPDGYDSTQWMGIKDLRTGREQIFLDGSERSKWFVFMGMSADGGRVLYREMKEYERIGDAWLFDAASGSRERVRLPEGELVADGVLGSSGDFAIVATTAGRVVRVDLKTQTVTTLIAETAYTTNLLDVAPGSLTRLRGTMRGTKENWAGKATVAGVPVPVVEARAGEIAIQIPWAQKEGLTTLGLDPGGDTPFVQYQAAKAYPAWPAIEPTAPGEQAILDRRIVKGDWSGFVREPPAPGELIHLLMTGLGPVVDPPKTGEAASTETLHPITGTIVCGFALQYDDPANKGAATTVFAGLAPGTIGVYQVSLLLPADQPKEIALITCKVSTASGYLITLID